MDRELNEQFMETKVCKSYVDTNIIIMNVESILDM